MSLLQEMEKFGLADCEANRPFFGPSTIDAHFITRWHSHYGALDLMRALWIVVALEGLEDTQ
jgi:hypothetical protein